MPYSRVVVVGIDGAGSFIEAADTPNFDRIFAEGAVTYRAMSCFPTISAECWGAMLLGVGPEIHKLTNEIVVHETYPSDAKYPTLFKRIRQAKPEAVMGSFCAWPALCRGLRETDIGVAWDGTYPDALLNPKICDFIREEKPDFFFIQYNTVDGEGHRQGYQSPKYMQQIHDVDALFGQVYDTLEKEGMLEDTLLLVIADHGGVDNTHGGWSDAEKYVTFAARGKNVRKGAVPNMNIRDLAAIVLYAFGIERPEIDENGWTSQIPEGLFDDPDIPAYRYMDFPGAAPRISKESTKSQLL